MIPYTATGRISSIETTGDTLTGRGGVAPFARYLSEIGLREELEGRFDFVRKSHKGLELWSLFVQVLCWLFDGTSRHLSYFDELAKEEGYAALLDHNVARLASSHAIKRFFRALVFVKCVGRFRDVLGRLFTWRLRLAKPAVVALGIDTMVLDNDEAAKRHGVSPTYKKVKGYQPLHLTWEGKIVDVLFRGGSTSGNRGNGVINMIARNVKLIRKALGPDVLIVIRLDAGFFDEAILDECNALSVAVILSGKMYDSVKDAARAVHAEDWKEYNTERQCWQYAEFGWKCDSWKRFYRTFYTRPVYENGQGILEFARPDNIIVTNLGVMPEVLARCAPQVHAYWETPEAIIRSHHGRGAEELPHRGIKDFGFEALPFKRFSPNAALYYCMVIGFFLFETYKQDVLAPVLGERLPASSYATTVRRKAVDFAAKVVRTGGRLILKVTRAVMERLDLASVWSQCQNPPRLQRHIYYT
jgi:hypothetical protein